MRGGKCEYKVGKGEDKKDCLSFQAQIGLWTVSWSACEQILYEELIVVP